MLPERDDVISNLRFHVEEAYEWSFNLALDDYELGNPVNDLLGQVLELLDEAEPVVAEPNQPSLGDVLLDAMKKKGLV